MDVPEGAAGATEGRGELREQPSIGRVVRRGQEPPLPGADTGDDPKGRAQQASAAPPLDSAWQLRPCLGDTWRWMSGPGRPPGEPGWYPARVPGTVLDDLHRAGQVPDPFTGTRSLEAEWVPQRTWLYRRPLTTRPLAPGERAIVRFEGVDHEATVLVDGKEIARHAGMFVPFDVDVTDAVADGGSHLLAVAVHPAPPNEPQVGRTDRVRVHKSRMSYGWDFCPRMIHQGIWKPVTLEITGPLRLVDARIGALPDEAGRTGHLRVDAAVAAGEPGQLHACVRAPGDGAVVAEGTADVPAGATGATLDLTVQRPRLWWPAGHGAQPLYTVDVTLRDRAGRTAGSRRTETGFRRVALVPNPGAPRHALPYTLQVNGRRIYAKGWNWVPMDARHGVPRPAKLAHLLGLAADAHVTLLRVWGGGLIETEDFYRTCDRLGLLVWQEFALSSSGIDSVPSADPDYLALMEREARALVPALRHHPSLAVWGPGNELHDTAAERPLAEADAPVIRTLASVVAELDPDRCWLPGSPSGPAFLNRADLVAAAPDDQHDVHGPWEHQGLGAHQRLYDGASCLLHTEFGVEGMANRRTFEAVVPPADRRPTGRANPVMEHLGAWWNNTELVCAAFGRRVGPDDPDAMRRASQQLQYDGLRYATEAHLRRAPRSSGAIPWQFNEPFPNAWCTSAVDHRGDPKPAYHGVRRAYRPAHVCARFATQAWGGHEAFTADLWSWRQDGTPEGSTVTARLLGADGVLHAEVALPAGRPNTPGPHNGVPAARAGRWRTALPRLADHLFVLDLALRAPDGALLADNRWVHSTTADLAPLCDLAEARVTVRTEPDLTAVHLAHTGGPAALGLYLTDAREYTAPGWAVFADNMIDLLPGETVRIPVAWRDAPQAGRTVRLEGWNIRATELS
ncbi:glycoside hydrolase family 2 protein [Streptomyces odontomachi]|uniref:glycoside hydrolase family 2 protein n=1 Tax=Streptomyces odontomachi TaxID=2944940 RepID=UPI00210981BA|nr:glycoside hydrolase family 2 TIM barrel-domain containing protein [Streptomyces sp. ODS25]